MIPRLIERVNVPGLSLAVVRDGEVCFAEGFGCEHSISGGQVTVDTVFEGASFSKPVFAYAVLKLWEKGLLDLDCPLTHYLGEPTILAFYNAEAITARHLLGHTSGLPNLRRKDDQSLNLEFETGRKFGYSTEAYYLMQLVVERVVDQPLNIYMKRHLFDPLGMGDSSYIWEDAFDGRVGYGHDRDGVPSSFRREHREPKAGISLHTRPVDFARFLVEMMAVDDGDDYRLSDHGWHLMLSTHVNVSDTISWGLGWGLEETDGGPAFWRWGDTGTYKNFTVAFREQRTGVVVMTNSANGLEVCEEIVNVAIGGTHPAFSFPMMNLRRTRR